MTCVRKRESGRTLLEMAVVAAIVMVVSAMALPRLATAVRTVRLRSAAEGVSSILQNTRMQAVKDNTSYRCRYATRTMGNVTYWIAYIDLNGSGSYDAGEPLLKLPANVRFDSSGSNPTFNNDLLGTGFTPQGPSQLASFNARGLPCMVTSGVCKNTTGSSNSLVGFLYFLRTDDGLGQQWAAVSVIPAGRVKVWTWDGSSWK